MTNDIRDQIIVRDEQLERRQAESMVRQIKTMTSPEAVRQVGIAARQQHDQLVGTRPKKKRKKQRSINKTIWLFLSGGMMLTLCMALGSIAAIPFLGVGMFGVLMTPPEQGGIAMVLMIFAGLLLFVGAIALFWFVMKGLSKLYDKVIEERIEYRAEATRRAIR